MPAKGKVSLTRQTIYCIIPLLDIYAVYRVQRLRKYFLIMLPLGFVVGLVYSTMFPETNWQNFDEFVSAFLFLDYVYDPIGSIPHMISHVGFVLLAIFLVRRWSKQWNKQF